jgi:hypothetical protein
MYVELFVRNRGILKFCLFEIISGFGYITIWLYGCNRYVQNNSMIFILVMWFYFHLHTCRIRNNPRGENNSFHNSEFHVGPRSSSSIINFGVGGGPLKYRLWLIPAVRCHEFFSAEWYDAYPSASPPFIAFSCSFSEIWDIYSPVNNVPVIV